MIKETDLLTKYSHRPEEFPVLKEQTHKVLRNGTIVNERININENIINYVQDTALLISVIDGSLSGEEPYDHVVYLDKSARPVSWLINMFWDDFATHDQKGKVIRRPPHSYINIDRAPWFRYAGIEVTDDGRQTADGELATFWDFSNSFGNLDERHFAEIRALYINGGIEAEDVDWIMKQPTVLDGKKVLIVDEVSRTGSTLKIAEKLFQKALPEAKIECSYFWHPHESVLMMGSEQVLTSLPVWYDPNTYFGRGIGGLDEHYYRNLYEKYSQMSETNPSIKLDKFRAYAFAATVFSTPILNDDGSVMELGAEKKTRALTRDIRRLHDEYTAGRVFFVPPIDWAESERFEYALKSQGVLLIPEDATPREAEKIRRDPNFYLNFMEKLKNYT